MVGATAQRGDLILTFFPLGEGTAPGKRDIFSEVRRLRLPFPEGEGWDGGSHAVRLNFLPLLGADESKNIRVIREIRG